MEHNNVHQVWYVQNIIRVHVLVVSNKCHFVYLRKGRMLCSTDEMKTNKPEQEPSLFRAIFLKVKKCENGWNLEEKIENGKKFIILTVKKVWKKDKIGKKAQKSAKKRFWSKMKKKRKKSAKKRKKAQRFPPPGWFLIWVELGITARKFLHFLQVTKRSRYVFSPLKTYWS